MKIRIKKHTIDESSNLVVLNEVGFEISKQSDTNGNKKLQFNEFEELLNDDKFKNSDLQYVNDFLQKCNDKFNNNGNNGNNEKTENSNTVGTPDPTKTDAVDAAATAVVNAAGAISGLNISRTGVQTEGQELQQNQGNETWNNLGRSTNQQKNNT